jgi:glycosyltransferase involved in cell wall biosynthesis
MIGRESRPKLLLITRQNPFPGASGSGAYVWGVLQHLARTGWQVHVAWTEPPDLSGTQGVLQLQPEWCRTVSLRVRGMRQLNKGRMTTAPPAGVRFVNRMRIRLGAFRRRFAAKPSRPASCTASPEAGCAWDGDAMSDERAFCNAEVRRVQPDWILANYVWMVSVVDRNSFPEVRLAVLAHDVRHRQVVIADGKAVPHWEEFYPRDKEVALLRRCDLIAAIQSTEARVFQECEPSVQVVLAPPTFQVSPAPQMVGKHLLFVGGSHNENVRGLHWFLNLVWPILVKRVPGIKLVVAGSVCDRFTREHVPQGVNFRGVVEDLDAEYGGAAVVIAPILRGSGFKIKLLEAAAHGRVCVTTSVGIEGAEQLCPPFVIADTPETFAGEIAALVDHPNRLLELGQLAIKAVNAFFTAPQCYSDLDASLRSLLPMGRQTLPIP